MKSTINSLEDLQREKEKLQLAIAANRSNVEQSLVQTKKSLSHFLLTRVALPAGALGLTAFGISKITGNNSTKSTDVMSTTSSLLSLLKPLLSMMLKLGLKDFKK